MFWEISKPGFGMSCLIRVNVIVKLINSVWFFATQWTVACHVPPSMGFPNQEYWSRLFPSPGDLPGLGIEPVSPALAGGFFTTEPPGKPKCSLPGVKKIASGKLLHATGSLAWCSAVTQQGGMGGSRGGDISIVDALCDHGVAKSQTRLSLTELPHWCTLLWNRN